MAPIKEAEAELPERLEGMFYQAFAAYYDYEAWKPALPRGMSLNEQPYGWRKAIECIRAARNRYEREEQVKQERIRQVTEQEE